MVKSLYDVIIQVNDAYDKVAEQIPVDRTPALKRAYIEYKSNPIVDAVIQQGGTNFADELLKYAKGDKTNKKYLEECLGLELPRVTTAIEEILGVAGMGGLIGMVGTSSNLSRREMLRISIGTSVGAALGWGADFAGKHYNRAILRSSSSYLDRANFLDNTYRSLR